jgi:hypothetical protein
MMQIDGGGSRKAMVRVVLAGTACSGDGDASDFHGHGHGLRRGPAVALVHKTEGKRGGVSAVSSGNIVQGSERRMGQPNGVAMTDLDGGSGCGGARPPGDARRIERVEWWSGMVWYFQRGAGWFI